jgi:alkanesulfonate monooxygenase SsuD/methylene tetrahydromethanopterin reductase-like flavin-dependent oxidoreductase (luciferase family)
MTGSSRVLRPFWGIGGARQHGVLILPDKRWSSLRERWTAAERMGYDHTSTYDHPMWRSLAFEPRFSAIPTLTAAATATSRIRLSVLVASRDFRHSVDFGKDVMPLDDISAGRFICRIAAGARGYDTFKRSGVALSQRERCARLRELVELIDSLIQSPVTNYRGHWYVADNVSMAPGCVQKPRLPTAVAGSGSEATALAAQYSDCWVSTGRPHKGLGERYDRAAAALKAQIRRSDDICSTVGRRPLSLRRILLAGGRVSGIAEPLESCRDASGLMEELGFTGLVAPWPGSTGRCQGSIGVLEQFAICELADNRRLPH